MTEFQRQLDVCNLSWCFVQLLRAHSKEEEVQAAREVASLSGRLCEEDVKSARDWAHAFRDGELVFWAELDAAAHEV